MGIGAGPFIGLLLYQPLNSNIFLTHLIIVSLVAIIFIPTAILMLRNKGSKKAAITIETSILDLRRI